MIKQVSSEALCKNKHLFYNSEITFLCFDDAQYDDSGAAEFHSPTLSRRLLVSRPVTIKL